METQAYFENIKDHIFEEIEKAERSLFIAVAWFTDKELFKILCKKAREGLYVDLIVIDDEINRKSNIDYDALEKDGGSILMINEEEGFMHNKFCVIDAETVVTGSYNWSYKAQSSHENIIVSKNAGTLASQFITEFNAIKNRYSDEPDGIKENIDLQKLLKRFETIKNFIILEDEEDIKTQINKLRNYNISKKIEDIIVKVENGHYAESITLIERFITDHNKVIIYEDPVIFGLKMEVKSLEIQIGALENEKKDIEKMIHDFLYKYNIKLGQFIEKILKIKLKIFKKEAEKDESKKEKYEEAKKDYEEYKQTYKEAKKDKLIELTKEEQEELKNKYRQASKLCHPDVVEESVIDEAEKIFNILNEAYKQNDLEKVFEIHENLKKGIMFAAKSESIDKKAILKAEIQKMLLIIKQLSKEIESLKTDNNYQHINTIDDWDAYFEEMGKKLKEELETLEKNE